MARRFPFVLIALVGGSGWLVAQLPSDQAPSRSSSNGPPRPRLVGAREEAAEPGEAALGEKPAQGVWTAPHVTGRFIQPPGIWTCLGPFTFNNTGPDRHWNMQGVVRSLSVDPADPQRLVLATPASGLMLTEDGGASFKMVATDLPVRGAKGIAFSKSRPGRVWAASDIGPLCSEDRGRTWKQTGLTGKFGTSGNIAADAAEADVAYAAYEQGVFVTRDGGASWSRCWEGRSWDVECHPAKSGVAYAVRREGTDWESVWRTENFGASWQRTASIPARPSDGTTLGRAAIAVTPADPERVYVAAAGKKGEIHGIYGLYMSRDGGKSFAEQLRGHGAILPASPGNPNLLEGNCFTQSGHGQYTWNFDLAASDVDANLLVCGAQMPNWSSDGGKTWKSAVTEGVADFSPHPDLQGFAFSKGDLWMGNDGGLYFLPKSPDGGFRRYRQLFGIPAIEIWGFDAGFKRDVMVFGCYHGPITYTDPELLGANQWTGAGGADAGEAFIHPGDENIFYCHPWFMNKLQRAEGGKGKTAWSPLGATLFGSESAVIDHSRADTLWAREETKLRRSRDAAVTWETVRDFAPGKPSAFETCYADSRVALTIVSEREVWRTEDDGASWSRVTPPDAGEQRFVAAALGALSSKTMVLIGRLADRPWRVALTRDGGKTWSDWGAGLPDMELRDAELQWGTDGGLYVAGEHGVWYRSNKKPWSDYSRGLPGAIGARFIKLNYAKKKIRIGTLRSLWEAPLAEPSAPVAHPMLAHSTGLHPGQPVRFTDHSVCGPNASYAWSFPGGNPEKSTAQKPVVRYGAPGDYSVTLTVKEPGGASSTRRLESFVSIVEAPEIGSTRTLSGSTEWQTVPFYREARGRYLTFEALSGQSEGQKLAGLAELIGLDANGRGLPRGDWRVIEVSSEENDAPAQSILDGSGQTFWHTRYRGGEASYPHRLVIDMGEERTLTGLKLLQRQNNNNVHIKTFRVTLR